jgi:hypothetical protein
MHVSRHPNSDLACEHTEYNHEFCRAFEPERLRYVHWPNPDYEAPKTVSYEVGREKVAAIAARLKPTLSPTEGRQAAAEGSEEATVRWTEDEKQRIREAIRLLAQGGESFTTDSIWARCPDIRPGPGITALLSGACSRGWIAPDGYAESSRERSDHDHGRRLRSWRPTVG